MAQDNNRNNKKTIAGKIEKIVFRNQNNGRTILSVLKEDGKTCRVIGNIQDIEVNWAITAIGNWQKDEKYGWQFVAETIQQDSRDEEDNELEDDGLTHAVDFSNVLVRKRKDFRDSYQAIKYDECEFVICDYDSDNVQENTDRININGAIYNKDMTTLISGPDQSSFIIPDSVTCIGEDAFNSCSSLEKILASEGNKYWSSVEGVLFNKDKTEIIRYPKGKKNKYFDIPNSVTSIRQCAFSGCSALMTIDIPNSVTDIGERAFSECNALTSIEIPKSITSIGPRAFSGCSSLTSIEISDWEMGIGKYAFENCSSLVLVVISGILKFNKVLIQIPDKIRNISEEELGECKHWLMFFIWMYKVRNSDYCNFLLEKHVSDQYPIIPIVEHVGGSKEYGALFTVMISGLPHIVWENFNDARATYVFQCKEDNYMEKRNTIIDFLYSDMENKRSYLRTNSCLNDFGEKPYMITHNNFASWNQRLGKSD